MDVIFCLFGMRNGVPVHDGEYLVVFIELSVEESLVDEASLDNNIKPYIADSIACAGINET